MTPEIIGFVILAAIVGGLVWAYGHIASFHAKLDLILHRNQAVDAQLPPAATPAPPQAAQPIEVHIHQPDPAPAPAAPPAAPVGTPGTPALTPQQSQNLLLYGNIYGPAPGQAGSPTPAPVAPTAPAANNYWQTDMANNSDARSPDFTLVAGAYVVETTEGLAQGYASAVLLGFGPVVGGQNFSLAADLPTFVVATAKPGNPSSTATRVGIGFRKTA